MHLSMQNYKKVLLPTKREIWIVLVLVFIVFLTFEANLIFLRITQNSIFTDSRLQESFESQIDSVFAGNKVINTATLVTFWAGMGLVAYSIIWSIYSFFSEAKNEVEVTAGFINQASKRDKLQRALVQAGLLAGIIALGIFTLNVTAPYFTSLWTNGILLAPNDWLMMAAQIVGGFIGLCINFYLFKVLIDWIVILE